MAKCRVKLCFRQALPDKVYCIKHIQGQRWERPVRPSNESYGTVKQGKKKRKNAE